MMENQRLEVATREFIGRVDSYDNENVAGWVIDPADPDYVFEVELYVDDVCHGRVRAGFPRADLLEHGIGSGNNAFYFTLPPAQRDESVKIEVRESSSQLVLEAAMILARTASPTFAGLSSTDASAMLYKPLLGLGGDAISFRGNHLTIKGMYLPPGGDPFAYDVIGDDGVVFELHRPLQDVEPLNYFWFWPNATWSMWRIDIDLAQTNHHGSAYRFEFRPKDDSRDDCAEVLYVPKDLGLWQSQPSHARRSRVQLGDFPEASPIRALMHSRAISDMARRHLKTLDGLRVLDWGCGWGRLARVFSSSEKFSELWGADIDEDNLAWARANIPKVTFLQVPLYPPTTLPSDHFDLIYGLSVMTHLTHESQEKWLAEIRRVLRPGGCAILTFHGSTALGFSTRYLNTNIVTNFAEKGFDDALACGDLDTIIGTGYYKNTFQSHDDVRKRWGAHLRIAEIAEAAIGIQDVAVLFKD
ncbi:class I SAM-dependent methyltransferase [Dyella tabacisoli]|uniref:Class I SAM-dependent methyltransferase n=1 Tax=Dyella tabacisoli TaxID=2282381 RepID=A0A369URN7_9GAMM|nr:class I SAM-dependent methyltransferase [Dyella tabacisoli]RDD83181.1 class I SAM-dependent methyltransferase [Dyella tabacisoli]